MAEDEVRRLIADARYHLERGLGRRWGECLKRAALARAVLEREPGRPTYQQRWHRDWRRAWRACVEQEDRLLGAGADYVSLDQDSVLRGAMQPPGRDT